MFCQPSVTMCMFTGINTYGNVQRYCILSVISCKMQYAVTTTINSIILKFYKTISKTCLDTAFNAPYIILI
jgi:hypothetical protein